MKLRRIAVASAALLIVGGLTSIKADAASADPKAFLSAYTPGTAHEATPHGVPSSYDWSSRATGPKLTPSTADSHYLNLWGQVYVDQSNVRPANTRVAVKNCKLLFLDNRTNAWRILQTTSTGMGGGFWTEDFRNTQAGFSLKNEPDGSYSMVPANGTTAHFWPKQGLVDGRNMKAAVVTCDTRLVLANPAGPDDRASARYLLSIGADWRKADYGCPFVNGITVCNGVGVGKMVRVDSNWKTVAYSTLSASQLAGYPLPDAGMLGLSASQPSAGNTSSSTTSTTAVTITSQPATGPSKPPVTPRTSCGASSVVGGSPAAGSGGPGANRVLRALCRYPAGLG